MSATIRSASTISWDGCPRPGRWRGAIWIALYACVLLAPLAAVLILKPRTGHSMLAEAGKSFALLAFTIIAMQFVLAARFKTVERPFGLDVVLRFHRAMAIFATVLLLAHPVLVAAGEGWPLLYAAGVPWFIWLGRLALLVLVTTILLSVSRAAVRLKFEWWRAIHNVLALLLLGLSFTHSWYAGDDLAMRAMRGLWIALLAVALLSYLDHRVLHPWLRRRRAFRVIEVRPETHNVWTVRLAPPANATRYAHLPGQFHFVTFLRGERGLPQEEHHWTTSSSPAAADGTLTTTIKASGDFTGTIGQTQVGDLASVRGPFGRFSYLLHPDETDLVFVAGGIGITPLMSMLRHLRDIGDARRVLLLNANRTEADIVFCDELDELSRGPAPRLTVVHVLSQPADDWGGETGRINADKLRRLCGDDDVRERAFYVCGPKGMTDAVAAALSARGVSGSRIHVEYFWLASG